MYSDRAEFKVRQPARNLRAVPATPRAPVTVAASRLWLAIRLPQFPLEVVLRGAEQERACVLVAGQGTRQRVLFVNALAARLNIRPGLPLSAVQALGEVVTLTQDPLAEARALEQLCRWAYQFSPLVSATGTGLVLEVQGSRRLFGGLKELFGRLRRELRELGYRGALAVAPTPGAAMALASAQRQQVVTTPEALAGALHELPIEALVLTSTQLQDLYAIGVRTVGDCGRLPREGLGRRFAPELLRMLDQIYGRQPDPRRYFEPPKEFFSRLELPWEVRQTQALHTAMRRLLHELTATLRAQAATTRELHWVLHQTDNTCSHHVVGLGTPSRDIERLSLVTRERFHRETLNSPVRALELRVTAVEAEVAPAMSDLFQPTPACAAESWPQFTARLRARLGEEALQGIAVDSDHRPERATTWIKWQGSNWQAEKLPLKLPPYAPLRVTKSQRPLWLTHRPIPLYEREGRLEWHGGLVVGTERERIESGWWGESIARDYFVATDRHGIQWWVYKELTGQKTWYLQGIFEGAANESR
ncbi:MAG: DNA polymerase Y family protein [Gammaproteobacteria bacterium]|nr:DNA polymerase Y family protein [Gammaproteobacteria bacterium]